MQKSVIGEIANSALASDSADSSSEAHCARKYHKLKTTQRPPDLDSNTSITFAFAFLNCVPIKLQAISCHAMYRIFPPSKLGVGGLVIPLLGLHRCMLLRDLREASALF